MTVLLPPPAPAPARTTARVVHGPAALAALHRLAPLWERTATPVTARATWLRAAAASCPGWEPVLVLVERAGDVVAAAPLAERSERGVRTVRLLDLGHADHGRLPADDDEAAATLARAVAGHLRCGPPWRLSLEQLPPDDAVLRALGRLLPLRLEQGAGCPLVAPDPAVPLTALLSTNGRKTLRAARNRLETDGRVLAVRWLRDDEVLDRLGSLQELRRHRDHAAGRASDLDVPAYAAFHTGLVAALAADGVLEALVLEVDGALAAYELCVRDGDVLRVLDGRVAPGLERYSAGWLSSVEVLDRVHRDPALRALDWLRGEQENKTRTGAVVVPAVRATAVSAPWVGQVDAAWAAARGRVLDVARRLVPPQRRHAVRSLLSHG